jgi:phospholipid/cholesterol/gamma-HCH transport system substrate-binding protein
MSALINGDNLSRRSKAVFSAVGAGVLLAGVLVTMAGAAPSHPGSTYYTASFGRAGQGMDHRSDVKIRGVTIGGIDSVTLDKSGRAVVRFRVDKGVRLPSTTVAQIEPVSVFGPKDLVLNLGTGEGKGPYLRDGEAIAKTMDPQELADTAWPAYRLASAIDPKDLATLLHTFSQGLEGQGPALRRTVDNGSKLIDLAHANRREIQLLLMDIQRLSGTLGHRGDTLVGITSDFNRLSPTIADRPDKINQLLTEVAELSRRTGNTLDEHGHSLGQAIDGGAGVVNVMHAELRNIPILLDALNGFFGGISQLISFPGPEGSLIAQVNNYFKSDVCAALIDLCRMP